MKLLIKINFLRRIYDDVTTFWKRWNLGTKSTQEESFFFFFTWGMMCFVLEIYQLSLTVLA